MLFEHYGGGSAPRTYVHRTFLEHMFTNMPKYDTVARKHHERCEHTSNMVSNISNICSLEHMFSNMPKHAFCSRHYEGKLVRN